MTTAPFETFKGPTCKGSYRLNTACGHCERCAWERRNAPGASGGVGTVGPASRARARQPRQTSATYDLGKDATGRPVTVTRTQITSGAHWTIRVQAVNQRDDSTEVSGLSDDNMRAIAEILT